MIIRKEVENSTAISAFSYDTQTEILSVEFTHGGVYQYPDVPEAIVREWMNAESFGKFFNQKVRKYSIK